jgi:CheY-like chemotaxis protein
MDLNMPVMDGFESCSLIKKHHADSNKKPYIVACSASEPNDELIEACRSNGFD